MTADLSTSAHLSANRVWGQLGSTTPTDVLDGCRARRVTGEVVFRAGARTATVELRAGSVERADLDGITGDAALTALAELREGTFEVVQRLPSLEGALGSAAEFQGELADIPLIQVMRHIEHHALTVTVTIVHEWDRGSLTYRDGDLVEVELNGDHDPDRIGELVNMRAGRFRVCAGILELPVPVRRAPRRAPTEPFHIGHLANRPRVEREAASREPAPLPAEVPAPAPRGRFEVVRAPLRRLIARTRRMIDRLEAALR